MARNFWRAIVGALGLDRFDWSKLEAYFKLLAVNGRMQMRVVDVKAGESLSVLR